MLNLSDKELDRLSKEAAQEYDPGEVLGSNTWDKLQVGLDSELGRTSPNPFRHIRRYPFYYAPALLLVVGLSYFLSRHAGAGARGTASGGPPGREVQAAGTKAADGTNPNKLSQKNTVNDNKSTSTPAASTTTTGSATTAGATTAAGTTTAGTTTTGATTAAASSSRKDGGVAAGNHQLRSGRPGSGRFGSAAGQASNRASRSNGGDRTSTDGDLVAGNTGTSGNSQTMTGTANGNASGAKPEAGLAWSKTPGLQSTRKSPVIGDSALRAFTLKSPPPSLRMRALYIKRTLQFGALIAPDYTSVNSLAGDKPGSTFGLTLDYEFANRWYVSSGLLVSRKIYAARSQDYHAPMPWLYNNGIHDLDFVKGSFEMLEIPLNLRYDFSVAGSTLFFVSAGLSSYLLTSENCNYYVKGNYGDDCISLKNPGQGSYLFAAANLSLGVETGLSNSLTLLIAPYAKLPVRNVGFGQVQLNSVGINFVLKYSPITSRKRH